MPRSVMDHLILSVEPDEGATALHGEYDTIATFNPDEAVIGYKGRLMIHTIAPMGIEAAQDAEQVRLLREVERNCVSILNGYGLTPETFPAWAIVGWVEVSKIFMYDADLFRRDADRHGIRDDLVTYQAQNGQMGQQCWGIQWGRYALLNPPVKSVMPPFPDMTSGTIWSPSNPLQLEAIKLALSAEISSDTEN